MLTLVAYLLLFLAVSAGLTSWRVHNYRRLQNKRP